MEPQNKCEIKPLPEELQKVAINELGEVPERIPEDLFAFKQWIKQQPHLKARMNDQFLVQFLRGCKYSLEKAKKKIDIFYSMKTKYPEYFNMTDVDDPLFRKLHNTGFFIPLPSPLNGHGPRIIMSRFKADPTVFAPQHFFQYCDGSVEMMLMNDPYACIYGVILVIDFAEATASHLLPFTINMAKQNAIYYEKAFPVRVKTFCFINLSKYAQQFLNLLLPHMSEKFRKRFILCGSEWSKHIPLEYMPTDYGGKNGCLEELCREYAKVWDEYRQYFKENANYGTDEHLRLGGAFKFDADLGTGGTFRKLNVD
ncbi:retinol-binding protein pinta-like [Musca vetustissima]|uniref:retinol-binding protein pinta-like n=1 Tax=Musca vetustissima TaxID=27455 RepID=UPI002AB5F58A|nr:retinol-binding protein pinta-like [Musca vetustissima]